MTVGSLAALVVFIGVTSPRFFFAGDKQNQYLPVARDIGRRLRAGEWLPVVDPDLGRSGNYALDLQYGLYEPTHWAVAIALSYVNNLTVAALLWAAAFMALLAAGVCALVMRLGAGGAWGAAVGVGVATSGYLLFWAAPSWIPALTSFAWVPWWWWAVSAPRLRWTGLVSSGVLAFLICGGGWPATWVIWACVVIGVLVEGFVQRDQPGRLRAALLHLLATAGGGVVALITVLPLQQAVDYTGRGTDLENKGTLVPNLADILAFASPGHEGGMVTFGGYTEKAPLFFGVWFVAVLVWLIPWRRAVLERRGVVASLVGLVLTLLVTQAPSNLGALRWPIRYLPGVPLFLGVGAAVAVSALGLRLTRGRLVAVVLSLLAVSLLSWFRHPDSDAWLLPSLLMLAAAALVLLAVARLPQRLVGTVALATTVLLAGWTVHENAGAGMTDRGTPPHVQSGALTLDQKPTLVLYPRRGHDKAWFPQGVAPGFLRLTATQRTQPGYSSLGQKAFDDRFCVQLAHAYTCGNAAEQVTDIEPTTGRRWADLLGYQVIVVHDQRHLERWRRGLQQDRDPGTWVQTGRTKDFVEFSRAQPLDDPGRVTATIGNPTVKPLVVDRQQQSYQVSTTGPATLVFRDFYWPGYRATLDGAPVHVSSLDHMLVTVDLPPGARGTLVVTYDPMPTTLWVSLLLAGSLLVLAAVLLAGPLPGRLRGRRRPR